MTLLEILALLAILSLLTMLIVRFLLPLIVSSSRLFLGIGATPALERTLSRIHADACLAGPKGLSFFSQNRDWTLALVRRTEPLSGQETWEKVAQVYRYHSQAQTLTWQSYPGLQWPDGSLRLTGQEPLHFSEDEMTSFPPGEEVVLCQFVQGQIWSKPSQLWHFTYSPPQSRPSPFLFTLSADLK